MAKESSFDIVSSVDMQEADNAYGQAKKELSQRYDLKGSGASITLDKSARTITVLAPSDFVCGQVIDVLESKLIRRKVDIQSLQWGNPENASGGNVRKTARIIEGIDRDTASAINKDIKSQKFKAKVQIEGDHLRVSSASKDTLQDVIAFVRSKDYGLPLQFTNRR